MTPRDALELLRLPPDEPATAEQTKRAYLRKLRDHSPERDAEGFRRVRDAYELVKYGWNPDDDDDDDDDDHDHVSDVHDQWDEHRHNTLDLGHFGAHRSQPAGLDGHVATLLRHLAHGDVAAARACERARPDIRVATAQQDTVLRYKGARELLDLADRLPVSAVEAYAHALQNYVPGAQSLVLAQYRKLRPADAWRALFILRHYPDSVLCELSLSGESWVWRFYRWIAYYDQTWAQLALLGVAIVIGIILEHCRS